MGGSKATRYSALNGVTSVVIVAQAARDPPPPPPQGGLDQVIMNTLLHPDLLQPPQIIEYAMQFQQGDSPLKHAPLLSTSRPEAFPGFQLLQSSLVK